MSPRTAVGPAQNLHLDRAARVAGEAFAFSEPEIASNSGWSLGWTLSVAAAIATTFAALAYLGTPF